MRSLEIRVPGRPPGANDLVRMGHWRVSKTREKWRQIAHGEAVRAMTRGPFAREWMLTAVGRSGRDPESSSFVQDEATWWPLRRASVAVSWRCKTRRRRDFDNLVSGLKPLLDALVSSGILEDDSTDVLVRIGPLTVEVGCPEDETVMTVTEEV